MTNQQLAIAADHTVTEDAPDTATAIGPVIALLPPPRNALLEVARMKTAIEDVPAAANDDDTVPTAAIKADPAREADNPGRKPARREAQLAQSTPAVRRRRRLQVTALSTATAISFSLTFMVVGLALLVGIIPTPDLAFAAQLDVGVLMLFVPLCALTLAVLFEVVRVSFRGVPEPATRPAPTLRWQPGNGEG